MVRLLSRHTGHSEDEVARDIARPKYFNPYEASERAGPAPVPAPVLRWAVPGGVLCLAVVRCSRRGGGPLTRPPRAAPLHPPPAVDYGIIDRVLEPEDEEVKRVVRAAQTNA